MKVNLNAREVCTTPSMNKKRNHFIYCDCSCWISSASCEKCGFNPVCFKGAFHEDQHPWLSLFFIVFRQEKKILVRKGRLLAWDQKRKSLIGW